MCRCCCYNWSYLKTIYEKRFLLSGKLRERFGEKCLFSLKNSYSLLEATPPSPQHEAVFIMMNYFIWLVFILLQKIISLPKWFILI